MFVENGCHYRRRRITMSQTEISIKKKKTTGKKDKIDTWDYIKLNSFYTAKETIIRVGETLEKMFGNHVFDIMG